MKGHTLVNYFIDNILAVLIAAYLRGFPYKIYTPRTC